MTVICVVSDDDLCSCAMGGVTIDHAPHGDGFNRKSMVQGSDFLAGIISSHTEDIFIGKAAEKTCQPFMLLYGEASCLVGIKGMIVRRIKEDEVSFLGSLASLLEIHRTEFGVL